MDTGAGGRRRDLTDTNSGPNRQVGGTLGLSGVTQVSDIGSDNSVRAGQSPFFSLQKPRQRTCVMYNFCYTRQRQVINRPMSYSIMVNPNVAFREIEDESVLLHLGRSRYFGLDDIATRAWLLFREHSRLNEIVDILLKEYDVEPANLRTDLESFVSNLVDNGLVTVHRDNEP